MRLRYIKGSIENIQKHPLIIQHPEQHKGRWDEIFGNQHSIHIEIGMGKGGFILAQAKKNPDINYIGIEKFSTVILRAVEKLEALEQPMKNLVLLRFDAWDILDLFDHQEIARIYLNFSDPWPREKQAKRRLIHLGYLNKYQQVLYKQGSIQFKTDNDILFDFCLEEVKKSTFTMIKVTRDLHHSEYVVDNIMTEYETKFVGLGKSINFIELVNQ